MDYERYIAQCIDTGILSKLSIRKYPLRAGNIIVVLKLFALSTQVPFDVNYYQTELFENQRVYLTDKGLTWLFKEIKKYTYPYLRSTFPHLYANIKPDDDPEQHSSFNNFKGLVGFNYQEGKNNKAMLVRQYGKNNRLRVETVFDTLLDARKEVLHLTRYYPAEQFTLYRLSKEKKNGVYYKYKVPLFSEENRRGLAVNLPHLKGKL